MALEVLIYCPLLTTASAPHAKKIQIPELFKGNLVDGRGADAGDDTDRRAESQLKIALAPSP